ncbi:peptidoglycan-binding domain-containing protein [uncultured Phascolarctobacterium sp.]|nr:peptidoglycan-binding domain-containing protein [uncultured Phascolarctobacterium sp.]
MGKRLTALLTLLALLCWLPLSAEAKKKTAKQAPAAKASAQQSDWRVKVAQQKLQALGLSKEKPSGRMTDATQAALKKFQQQHKLKASGALDDKTYRKLT